LIQTFPAQRILKRDERERGVQTDGRGAGLQNAERAISGKQTPVLDKWILAPYVDSCRGTPPLPMRNILRSDAGVLRNLHPRSVRDALSLVVVHGSHFGDLPK